MKPTSAFYALVLLIALCGCGKKNEPITVYLGIYEDGTGFWDWNGVLKYRTSSNGSLEFPTPMRMSGTFTTPSNRDSLQIELNLEIDSEENYIVHGTAESKHAGNLVLLGTGDTETDDSVITFTTGSNAISFSGELKNTYTKE